MLSIGIHRDLADLEPPLAGEGPTRAADVRVDRSRIPVDAAATSAISDSHDEDVPACAQSRRCHGIVTRLVVAIGAADLDAVHPGDVVVVDDAQGETKPSLGFILGERE